MLYRQLGQSGLKVSALGYGAMGLEGYYGAVDDAQAVDTLRHVLDRGINFIDTADAYGAGHNEGLVARALAGRPRHEVVVATKFGIVYEPETPGRHFATGWGFSLKLNGSPRYARMALERSLRRLRVDYLDLWYLHYPDPGTPIEESVGAMAEAVRAGHVRALGLSNVTAGQLRRAATVHPIAAVQFEYSLWRREAEADLLPAARGAGAGFVAWGPLGSGFLAGTVTALAGDDFRRNNPRFAGDNLAANLDRFTPLRALAAELNLTPAQLALSWLLHQGHDVVPIPCTRWSDRVDENLAAASVQLSAADLARIDALAPPGWARGGTLLS